MIEEAETPCFSGTVSSLYLKGVLSENSLRYTSLITTTVIAIETSETGSRRNIKSEYDIPLFRPMSIF